jgi:hypothetical protein
VAAKPSLPLRMVLARGVLADQEADDRRQSRSVATAAGVRAHLPVRHVNGDGHQSIYMSRTKFRTEDPSDAHVAKCITENTRSRSYLVRLEAASASG